MPTDTFFKLSEQKKQKILKAAKKEFARIEFEQTSIKNIVEEAEIARGSFYQYFESKEELLKYIIEQHIGDMENKIRDLLIANNGDIILVYINMYDMMLNQCSNKKEIAFYKKIFENMRTSQNNILKDGDPESILIKNEKLVDKSRLKIETNEDYKTIIKLLGAVTMKAMVTAFKYASNREAKIEYLKEIEFLKYGILKEKESEV